MDFDLVVAYDKNKGIGKGGKMPWRISSELRHFREITMNTGQPEESGLVTAVMMGRVTWDSLVELGIAPLRKRKNIVVSRQTIDHSAVDSVRSIEEGLQLLAERTRIIPVVYGIGGEQFYIEALRGGRVRRIHATEIDYVFDCDKHFPQVVGFRTTSTGPFHQEAIRVGDEDRIVRFRYVTYQRK